jgi:hypothetical protein
MWNVVLLREEIYAKIVSKNLMRRSHFEDPGRGVHETRLLKWTSQ